MTTEAALLALLRTLATHPAARGLADDVALLGQLAAEGMSDSGGRAGDECGSHVGQGGLRS